MVGSKLELRVQAVRREAEGISSFEFAYPDGAELPAFTAGAHIDIELPNDLVRQYSICSDPRDRRRYVVAVLRDTVGRGGSIAMHDSIKEGQLVTITEPLNNFPLSDNALKHLLIAGGIGITPMLAMVRDLEARGEDFKLHYCTRAPEMTAFMDYLQRDSIKDRVHFHFDGGDPSRGLDVVGLLRPYDLGTHVYCCGPTGLMSAVRDAADHWPMGTVHFEYFSVDPALAAGSGKDEAFEVEIESSGEVHQIPLGTTILEALRTAGHDLPSACEEGICGTCITEVASGEIDHRDMVLDEEEQEAGDLITICCSRARGKLVLKI